MKKKLLASALPLLLCGAAPLWAQSETLSLDTVVVTADRSAETLREISRNMDVITEEDIQNSAAVEITDILKNYGLQITQNRSSSSGQESVTIRGFSSSYHGNDVNSNVLILIDGRRAVGDSLSMYTLNNIARIEIIRGPGAMQYGSSAMGGVVNIITKRGGERPNVRLETGFGSRGYNKHSLFGSGQIGQLDFSAAVSYQSGDNFKDGGGVIHDESGLEYRVSSMANLGWNFNEYHRLGLSAQAARTNDAGAEWTLRSGKKSVAQLMDKNVNSLDLLYEGRTETGDKAWLARYFQGVSSYQIDYIPVATYPAGRYKNSRSENDFKGAQAQLSWDFDRVGLTGGFDWLSYEMDQRQYDTKAALASTNLGDYENIGSFLIGKVSLLEDRSLVLSGGLRYDQYKVTMDNDVVGKVVKNGEQSRNFNKMLPSVGLAYNPTDFLKLRAHYGVAYKVPTPRELAGGFAMGSTTYHGNPKLEPEEARTWEAGFDFEQWNLKLSGTYFHTKYDNYIGAVIPDGESSKSSNRIYKNFDDTTINGMEWRLAYDLGRQLDWAVDLTPYFNATRLFTYETGENKRLPGLAETSLGFGLGFAYEPFGLTIDLDGTYYGAQEVATYSTQALSARQGGATVWDLSVVKRLRDFEDYGDLKLKVTAKNMFNKYYDTSDGTYMPGSTVYIGLIWDLK